MKQKDLYQIALKAILKNEKQEILILSAVSTGTFKGFYDLPGGRIDIDEFETDVTEILKREIKEELGSINFAIKDIPVSYGRHRIPYNLSGDDMEKHVFYLFFEVEYLSGDIKISEEHTGYKWIDLKNIDLEKTFTSGILEGIKKYILIK